MQSYLRPRAGQGLADLVGAVEHGTNAKANDPFNDCDVATQDLTPWPARGLRGCKACRRVFRVPG